MKVKIEMKKMCFLVCLLICGVGFSQDLMPPIVPVPDTIGSVTPSAAAMLMQQPQTPPGLVPGQTLGQMLRLCVEIQADITRADFAAGAAKKELASCQSAYNAAVQGSMQAASDFYDSSYMNPLYLMRMNYWAGQIMFYQMRINLAQGALNQALAELTMYQLEFANKGC